MAWLRRRPNLSQRYSSDLRRVTNVIAERKDYRIPRVSLQTSLVVIGLVSAAFCLLATALPHLFPVWVADGAFLATAVLTAAAAAVYQHPALKILPATREQACRTREEAPPKQGH